MDLEILRSIPKVLDVTDALGIHREAVEVPLDTTPFGSMELRNGKLVIMLPDTDPTTFLEHLPKRLSELEGFATLRRAE